MADHLRSKAHDRYLDMSWMMDGIDVVSVIERLGLPVVDTIGDEIVTYCPDHHLFVDKRPSHPKWAVNVKTGKTQCWTEGRGSNLVFTVSRLRSCTPKQAALWIVDASSDSDLDKLELSALGGRISSFWDTNKREVKSVLKLDNIRDEVENPVVFDSGYEYFMNPPERKPMLIRRETVDRYKVFQRDYGYYNNRVLLPVSQEGDLVGFCAFDILGETEWKKKHPTTDPKNGYKKVLYPKGMKTRGLLFGYDDIRNGIDAIILTEGPKEVMKLSQEGYDAVALFRSAITPDQIKLLSNIAPKKVYVMMDGDDVGRVASLKIAKRLSSFFNVYICDMPDGYDPKNLKGKEIKSFMRKALKYERNEQ